MKKIILIAYLFSIFFLVKKDVRSEREKIRDTSNNYDHITFLKTKQKNSSKLGSSNKRSDSDVFFSKSSAEKLDEEFNYSKKFSWETIHNEGLKDIRKQKTQYKGSNYYDLNQYLIEKQKNENEISYMKVNKKDESLDETISKDVKLEESEDYLSYDSTEEYVLPEKKVEDQNDTEFEYPEAEERDLNSQTDEMDNDYIPSDDIFANNYANDKIESDLNIQPGRELTDAEMDELNQKEYEEWLKRELENIQNKKSKVEKKHGNNSALSFMQEGVKDKKYFEPEVIRENKIEVSDGTNNSYEGVVVKKSDNKVNYITPERYQSSKKIGNYNNNQKENDNIMFPNKYVKKKRHLFYNQERLQH